MVHFLLKVSSWMITMSLDGKGICRHALVLIFELTSVTILGFSPCMYLQSGYTTLQWVLALVFPNVLRAGSCRAKMSQSSDIGPLRRVS